MIGWDVEQDDLSRWASKTYFSVWLCFRNANWLFWECLWTLKNLNLNLSSAISTQFPEMLLFVDRISKLFTAITPSWVMESIWIFLWRYLEVFLWSEKNTTVIPQSGISLKKRGIEKKMSEFRAILAQKSPGHFFRALWETVVFFSETNRYRKRLYTRSRDD